MTREPLIGAVRCQGRAVEPETTVTTEPAVLYKTTEFSYDTAMRMQISAARDRLAEAIEVAQTEAVHLERHGVPVAVLISPARYNELMTAWEDAEDMAAFDEAMAEEGPNIPWEQVKVDLGWAG
jgi:PHD/YefM family antitoxin component YafN of YafNO toxin-antitoxin module